MLMHPVWNKTLKMWEKLFELIQIGAQCSKNYFKISLSQEAWASGKIRKTTVKTTPKIEN